MIKLLAFSLVSPSLAFIISNRLTLISLPDQSLALTYLPRVDGIFFKANPQQLVLQGSVAPVPIVTGDCDDEGTLFSLSSANITSEKQKEAWIAQNYLPHASRDELAALAGYYPADPVVGSPYGTGELNQLTPVFKSIASIQGDGVFQGTLSFFLFRLRV